MAGDWIKMRHDLPDDPAVIGIASQLKIEEDLVVGKLHRFWSWADRQTIDGNASSVTLLWLDRYLSAPGFAQAMVNVGWLEVDSDGIKVPKFDQHISESAKRRGLTTRRVAKSRGKNRNATGVTKTLPEKRREEKRKEEETPCSPPRKTRKPHLKPQYPDDFEAFWKEYPRRAAKGRAAKAFEKAMATLTVEKGSREASLEYLLERTRAFAMSDTGKSGQYCPHAATWLNDARWGDDEETWKRKGSHERSTTVGPGQRYDPDADRPENPVGTF